MTPVSSQGHSVQLDPPITTGVSGSVNVRECEVRLSFPAFRLGKTSGEEHDNATDIVRL